MTHPRPLTPLEVDTIRVGLELLLHTAASSPDLVDARVNSEVSAIAHDDAIAQLLDELDGAQVSVRRAGP